MPSLAQTSRQIGCMRVILNVERLKKKMKKKIEKKIGKKLKNKIEKKINFFFSIFLYMDVAIIDTWLLLKCGYCYQIYF